MKPLGQFLLSHLEREHPAQNITNKCPSLVRNAMESEKHTGTNEGKQEHSLQRNVNY